MSLQDVLNSQMDLASVAAGARRGLVWWRDELAGVLPEAWRERLSSRPRVWIEPRPAGGWRLWKDGRTFDAVPAAALGRTKVGLLIPPGACLTREITIARMPAADVRRMLNLDVDRLSPLAPELIHFDLEIVEQDEAEGRQKVLLGILPRDEAAALLSQARAAGYAPVALAVQREPNEAPRFDFLPQVKEASGETGETKARLYWWSAALALIVVNIAVLVVRDIADVSRLQAVVDAQQPLVNSVLHLRQRVESEDARRRGLLARGTQNDPRRMLSALTQALPAGAWVQHLEWNGQSLRITGFRNENIDMNAVIQASGAFVNPRTPTGEPGTSPTSVKPFDVSADARPRS